MVLAPRSSQLQGGTSGQHSTAHQVAPERQSALLPTLWGLTVGASTEPAQCQFSEWVGPWLPGWAQVPAVDLLSRQWAWPCLVRLPRCGFCQAPHRAPGEQRRRTLS